MSLVRAFIAIDISPEIRTAIDKQTASLRNALGPSLMRWVPTKNVHLTLKFLGEISAKNIEILTQLLDVEASQHEVFEIHFGGMGTFPNAKRPRVFWIGIQAPQELLSLQRGIEAATTKLGYPVDKRAFSPHLTIARVNKNIKPHGREKIREVLREAHAGTLGSIQVKAVHLYKSDLKPSGAVYTQLHLARLAMIQDEIPNRGEI